MLTDAYDGIADLLTFEDAKNQTITSTYDALGRAKTKQDPLLRTESHLYDGLDNLTSGCTTIGARYYSPRLQRFVSEDPIGFDGGNPNL